MSRKRNVTALTRAIQQASAAAQKANAPKRAPSVNQAVQGVSRSVSSGASQTTRRAAKPRRKYTPPPKVGASIGSKTRLPYPTADPEIRRLLVNEDKKRAEKRYERTTKRDLARKKDILRILMAGPLENEPIGDEGDVTPRLINRAGFYSTPTLLARSNFESFAKALWPELGLKGKRPKLDFSEEELKDFDLPSGKKAYKAAEVPFRKNKVTLAPNTPAQLQIGFRYGNKDLEDYYRLLLAHEFAHTRQPPIRKGKYDFDKRLIEGGAEEFTRLVGTGAIKRAGYRKPDFSSRGSSGGYAPYRKYTRKHRSKKWIKKGQFT